MDNIMFNASGIAYYGCLKCKAELDRRTGKWVAKYAGRPTSGYWVPLLVVPNKSAQYVLDKKKELTEEQFANFVLGQPFVGRGNVLTRQMLLQNLTTQINPQDTRPIIGVDTGVGINVVVGNKYGTFYYNKTDGYDEVRSMLKRWPNAICVIDQGGDIIGPRKLREEFPNRVFLCFFRASQKNDELIKWDDTKGTVVADRNRLLQLVVDEFTEKRMPLYGTESDWLDYMLEWLGMYRTVEEDALGIPKFQWNKPSSGRCDYPFAQVYLRIGLDRFLEQASTFHEPGGNDSFAETGLDVGAEQTAFLPKN